MDAKKPPRLGIEGAFSDLTTKAVQVGSYTLAPRAPKSSKSFPVRDESATTAEGRYPHLCTPPNPFRGQGVSSEHPA